jgi:hypothetical protein
MSKIFKDRANDLYVSPPLGDSQEAEVEPMIDNREPSDSRSVSISEPIITANELPDFL